MANLTVELPDEIVRNLQVYGKLSKSSVDDVVQEACYDFLQKMMDADDRLKTLETAQHRFRRRDLYRHG